MLYVPAFPAVAVPQLNYFNVGLKTIKLGSIAPVVEIFAEYVYIASVQVWESAKSRKVIEETCPATPTSYVWVENGDTVNVTDVYGPHQAD